MWWRKIAVESARLLSQLKRCHLTKMRVEQRKENPKAEALISSLKVIWHYKLKNPAEVLFYFYFLSTTFVEYF